MNAPADAPVTADPLVIAGRAYRSRLLVGTGKYRDFAQTRDADRRLRRRDRYRRDPPDEHRPGRGAPSLLDALPPSEFTYLPNSAGCYTADDAVRTLKLARELLDGHALCKLEVLGDKDTLYPDVRETLKAAERLVADGFQVMVYTSDDPIVARELEKIGCVAIMPLASLIGSGMGILNPWNLKLILDAASVPVLVDAGVGTASDAAIATGAGLRRRADEHRDCAGGGPGADGARDAPRGGSRSRGIPRRPDGAQAVRRRAQLADDRPDPMTMLRHPRALCARTVFACALAFAPCAGAAPTAVQITELCKDAEDQAHCGRLIEQAQMKRLPGMAERDGRRIAHHAVSDRRGHVPRQRFR